LLFPEPKEQQQSWATRGVLGEQLWTAERPQDLSMLLSGASATFFAGGLLTAYKRQLWPLMFYASAAYLLKLWYIDRMTFYYEQHRKQEKRVETQATTSPPPV
jgi:hypothetical protein